MGTLAGVGRGAKGCCSSVNPFPTRAPTTRVLSPPPANTGAVVVQAPGLTQALAHPSSACMGSTLLAGDTVWPSAHGCGAS